MPKSHPPYSPEFRQRIIELVRKGRTPEELARQFEPSAQAIRLRREVRQLREERAILSKAAAWFARETNTIPTKDSSS
jgi:transposase